MFLPRETPLELGPEQLLGLRLSLNTPVVGTEEVPTGPARAALAVHRDAVGRTTITLAVRPVPSGHAVFYGLEEELGGEVGLSVGIDAALSFGESLGFLFDDDAIASGAAVSEALALWESIVGDTTVMKVTGEPRRAGPSASADLEDELGAELLLEDLALDEDELEALPEPCQPPPEPEPPAPTPTLSKFRAVADPTAERVAREPEGERDPAERPRRALLARVRLIKRAEKVEKRPEEAPDAEPDRIVRLLSSF